MEEKRICMAGSGGQGVLFIGKILATAGMLEEKEVTLIPSYGAEVRGGIVNCMVIISGEDIGSPIVQNPDILVAMNGQALKKYESKIAQGGLLFSNSSLIDDWKPAYDHFYTWYVPATEIAKTTFGNIRLANMIMLGALLRKTGMISMDKIEQGIHLLTSDHQLASLNLKAFGEGADYLEKGNNR